MDAITLLREDHQKVLAMFDRLEDGPSVLTGADDEQLRARGELVTELIVAESQHEAVEEQFFWPAVRDALPDGDALADHATAQEQEAKHMLQELEWQRSGNAEFEKLVATFISAGRRHIGYEQDEVWPRLQAALSQEQLEELGEKMAKAKQSAPTRPHPLTPPKPGVLKTVGAAAAKLDSARDSITGRGQH
jgi:hemerythrin-like domain-containing protein